MVAKKRTSWMPHGIEKTQTGYRARVSIGGKQCRGTVRAEIETAIVDRERMREASPVSVGLTVEDAWVALFRELERKEVAAGTLRYYREHRARLDSWLRESTPLAVLDRQRVETVLAKVRTPALRGKTRGVLRRLCRLCVREGWLGVDPVAATVAPSHRAVETPGLPWDLARTLIAALRDKHPREADVAELLLRTGVRRGEAARMQAADIDLVGLTLLVRGKNADRRVPFQKALVDPLKRLLADPAGESVVGTPAEISRGFVRSKAFLGAPEWSPHVMRVTFVTRLVDKETPLPLAQSLTGHATASMLARYYRATEDKQRAVLDGLD
jgi:integrase